MNTGKYDRKTRSFGRALSGNLPMAYNQKVARCLVVLVTLFITLGSGATVQAQEPSTDFGSPTPLTRNVLNGGGVDEKTQYFYSFAVVPGKVNLGLQVKANKEAAVSSVDISVLDSNSNSLLSTYANPDHGGSKNSQRSINVTTKQTLILQVTVSPGVNTFAITLAGAVDIQAAADVSAGSSTSASQQAAVPNDQNSSSGSSGEGGNAAESFNNQTITGTAVDVKTRYLYQVAAGPGDVILKLRVKSQTKAAVSSVDIEVLNNDSKPVVAGFANPSFGETKQMVLKTHLTRAQGMLITVVVSPGVDNYSLNLSGALKGAFRDLSKPAANQLEPRNPGAINATCW